MRDGFLPALILAALAGCNVPGPRPGDLSAPFVEVEQGPARFRVFRRGDEAVAIRTNVIWGARPANVWPHAARAITRATGCAVDPARLSGDAAVIRASLSCEEAAPGAAPAAGR